MYVCMCVGNLKLVSLSSFQAVNCVPRTIEYGIHMEISLLHLLNPNLFECATILWGAVCVKIHEN